MEGEMGGSALKFEDGTYTIGEISRNVPLPIVVQCDTSNAVPVDRTRFNFDLLQPLLLYRTRNIQKVTARSVHIDPASRAFHDVGETLLIPEDYKGFFSVLKKNYNNGPIDDFVPHYQEVSEIADTATEIFLIGGERRVQALQVVRRENGSIVHQQRTLFPGDVLRKGKVYIGEKKRKSKILRKTKIMTEKYLLCTDDSDREILLPFDQKGLFYTLSTTTGNANRPVMQMSQIVAKRYLPCIARLIYGRIPNTPCSFSGTLRLERAELEKSVIAATLVNARNILLEIPTVCDLQFKVAITNEELVSFPSYKNALDLCNEKGAIYMRNMKVCYTIASDSHRDTRTAVSNEDVPHDILVDRRKLSFKLSCDTDDSGDGNTSTRDRTSDYVEMRSVKSDSVTEENIFQDDPNSPVFSPEVSHTGNIPIPRTYKKSDNSVEPTMLQIFLENNFVSVEMVDAPESDNNDLSVTEAPEEPPPRCPITEPAPKPCMGSFDSGIQMEPDMNRRPSTLAFSEARRHYEDDITYDIPRLPSRRVSAPAGYTMLPSMSESDSDVNRAKEKFGRRASSAASNTRMKPLIKQMPITTEDSCDESPVTESSIPEYNSEEEYLEPMYQNVSGSDNSKTQIQRRNQSFKMVSSENTISPTCSQRSSMRDSGHLSDDYSPSSQNRKSDRLSPNIFQTQPIGKIPELPRKNSISLPRDSDDDLRVLQMEIPALPRTKDLKKSCKNESVHINVDDNENELDQKESLSDSELECHSQTEEDLFSYSNAKRLDHLYVNEMKVMERCSLNDQDEAEGMRKEDVGDNADDAVSDRYVTFPTKSTSSTVPEIILGEFEEEYSSLKDEKEKTDNDTDSEHFDSQDHEQNESEHILHVSELESLSIHEHDHGSDGREHCSDHNEEHESDIGKQIHDSDHDEPDSDHHEHDVHDSGHFELGSDNHEHHDVYDHSNEKERNVFLRNRFRKKSNVRQKQSRKSKDISKMTVDDLAIEFKRIGIKQQTIDIMKRDNLGGVELLEKYRNHDSIREFLPSAGLIDQQKISLFIQGCKY